MLTKVGVFYAAVNASTNEGINIEIGGRGEVTLTSIVTMGVFYADTGSPCTLHGSPLLRSLHSDLVRVWIRTSANERTLVHMPCFAVLKQGRNLTIISGPRERNALFVFKLSDSKQRLHPKWRLFVLMLRLAAVFYTNMN